jgi:glycogen synthase
MMSDRSLLDTIRRRILEAMFFMLRYETEFTPCTGITAVTKQERRNFLRGIMIAPWCSLLPRSAEHLRNGKVRPIGWSFLVEGHTCNVLATDDEFAPILFLDIEGRFRGTTTPYDGDLRLDTLYYGLAAAKVISDAGSPHQFVWGADWESVPALLLSADDHLTALTIHNSLDECLEKEAAAFGETFRALWEHRPGTGEARTALEVGMPVVDVLTTVNRGFSHGIQNEILQQEIMLNHVRQLVQRVVGINNGPFASLSEDLVALGNEISLDLASGTTKLLAIKAEARAGLPKEIFALAQEKVIVVSMGRRVAQKQHDLLVESLRLILRDDREFPVLAVFATVHGDTGSEARLERIKKLQEEFPRNVICLDGVLPYYGSLMAAADYNAMSSIFEPHGGAYESTVIPIASAVDGLAEQICARDAVGHAADMNRIWHGLHEPPTGFLFSGRSAGDESSVVHDLRELINISPSPDNTLFRRMRDALTDVLRKAIRLRLDQPDEYARLVAAAVKRQQGSSWLVNLGGILALVEQARADRSRRFGVATFSKVRTAA